MDSINRDLRTGTQYIGNWASRVSFQHIIALQGIPANKEAMPSDRHYSYEPYEPWSKLLKGGLYRGLYRGLL